MTFIVAEARIMLRIIGLFTFLLSVAVTAIPAAMGQEADWKVGLARVKITPEQPVFMAGYSARNKPFERVHDDLYAKVLVLEDQAGKRGVLVTSDLIGFAAAVADPLRERIAKQTGAPATAVIVNSSHTHTGPSLDLDDTPRESRGGADSAKTVAYTKELSDKIVQAAAEAAKKLQPVKLSWGSGVVHFVMNRREF